VNAVADLGPYVSQRVICDSPITFVSVSLDAGAIGGRTTKESKMRHGKKTTDRSFEYQCALCKTLGHDNGGWYAEVYTDDDNASGYGSNAMVGRWYGRKSECERLDPEKVRLYRYEDDRGSLPNKEV